MTDSQKKVLELLPKMAEKFPKRFMFDGWGSYAYFLQVEGDKLLPACLTYVDRQTGELRFSYITPALIVEAVRLEFLEWGHQLTDDGDSLNAWLKPQEWLLPTGLEYKPQDPFDRARAALELLEVAA